MLSIYHTQCEVQLYRHVIYQVLCRQLQKNA